VEEDPAAVVVVVVVEAEEDNNTKINLFSRTLVRLFNFKYLVSAGGCKMMYNSYYFLSGNYKIYLNSLN